MRNGKSLCKINASEMCISEMLVSSAIRELAEMGSHFIANAQFKMSGDSERM